MTEHQNRQRARRTGLSGQKGNPEQRKQRVGKRAGQDPSPNRVPEPTAKSRPSSLGGKREAAERTQRVP